MLLDCWTGIFSVNYILIFLTDWTRRNPTRSYFLPRIFCPATLNTILSSNWLPPENNSDRKNWNLESFTEPRLVYVKQIGRDFTFLSNQYILTRLASLLVTKSGRGSSILGQKFSHQNCHHLNLKQVKFSPLLLLTSRISLICMLEG